MRPRCEAPLAGGAAGGTAERQGGEGPGAEALEAGQAEWRAERVREPPSQRRRLGSSWGDRGAFSVGTRM